MPNKVRILHVVANMQIGGINRFVIDICRCQRENHSIEVAIYICSSKSPQWRLLCESLDVKLYWDDIKPLDINPFHYRSFLMVRRKYDIIHWHIFCPLMSLTSFFDNKIHLFTHHSILGLGRLAKSTDVLKWKLFKLFVNNRIDCEIYNSQYTQHFWKSFGLHSSKERLIYNGILPQNIKINITSLSKDVVGFIKNSFVIGTSSNLVKLKRVDLLISAFAAWSTDKSNVKLLIVGDGAEQNNLSKLVTDLNVSDKVFFTGYKSNVTDYQMNMDICVFPSTTETFGLAALECLRLGKPTLCMNDGGGICEVIGDGENIVSDIVELQKRFDYYYNLSPLEYANESNNARQRSLLFDMEDKAIEYVELYQSLIISK